MSQVTPEASTSSDVHVEVAAESTSATPKELENSPWPASRDTTLSINESDNNVGREATSTDSKEHKGSKPEDDIKSDGNEVEILSDNQSTRAVMPNGDESQWNEVRGADESSDVDEEAIREEATWREQYADLRDQIGEAPDQVKQFHKYYDLLEKRIAILEGRWSTYDKRIKKPALVQKVDPEQLFAIPKLNPVNWEDFQASVKLPTQQKSAIDILRGEPLIHFGDRAAYEGATDHAVNKSSTTVADEDRLEPVGHALKKASTMDPNGDVPDGPPASDISSPRAIPERIRVNSSPLLQILNQISGDHSLANKSMLVILSPYKMLLSYEEQIRERLKALKGAWMTLEDWKTRLHEESENRDPNEDEPKSTESSNVEGTKHSPTDKSKPSSIKETELDQEKKLSKLTKDRRRKPGVHKTSCLQCLKSGRSEDCMTDSPSALDHLTLLVQFLDEYVKPIVNPIRERKCQKIAFWDLWHLFHTGDEATMKRKKEWKGWGRWQPLGFRVLHAAGGRYYLSPKRSGYRDVGQHSFVQDRVSPFRVHTYYIDFDGSTMVPISLHFAIDHYDGERDITDLDIFPYEYATESGQTKALLIERGKKFVQFTKPRHMHCEGLDIINKEEIDGQVMVDFKEGWAEQRREGELGGLDPPRRTDRAETWDCPEGCNKGSDSCPHGNSHIHDDAEIDVKVGREFMATQRLLKTDYFRLHEDGSDFTEDELALCNYRVHAYVLRARQWVLAFVEELREVTRLKTDRGFNMLVLPKDHRHIIRSQVREHFRKKRLNAGLANDEVDIVRGKGKGLIILLHGAPGVGKTCTAECVADLVQKPLFPITCGDLGTTATDIEDTLSEHFRLATKWDCVLLLDEADVFLAKRGKGDYNRNSVVSVFLRMMEYYTGILFLTTNRVGTFDEAFKSRIHLSLWYPQFDKRTMVKVWRTYIERTRSTMSHRNNFRIKEQEILDFAKDHYRENEEGRWNGRQIRNAFQTAIALAEYEARDGTADTDPETDREDERRIVTLRRSHFEKVAGTVRDFDMYMKETLGMTHEVQALREGARYDTFTPAKKGKKMPRKKGTVRDPSTEESDAEDEESATSSTEESANLRTSTKSKKMPQTPKNRSKTVKSSKGGRASSPSESSATDSGKDLSTGSDVPTSRKDERKKRGRVTKDQMEK